MVHTLWKFSTHFWKAFNISNILYCLISFQILSCSDTWKNFTYMFFIYAASRGKLFTKNTYSWNLLPQSLKLKAWLPLQTPRPNAKRESRAWVNHREKAITIEILITRRGAHHTATPSKPNRRKLTKDFSSRLRKTTRKRKGLEKELGMSEHCWEMASWRNSWPF